MLRQPRISYLRSMSGIFADETFISINNEQILIDKKIQKDYNVVIKREEDIQWNTNTE